jgi:hypothetical protein
MPVRVVSGQYRRDRLDGLGGTTKQHNRVSIIIWRYARVQIKQMHSTAARAMGLLSVPTMNASLRPCVPAPKSVTAFFTAGGDIAEN